MIKSYRIVGFLVKNIKFLRTFTILPCIFLHYIENFYLNLREHSRTLKKYFLQDIFSNLREITFYFFNSLLKYTKYLFNDSIFFHKYCKKS